MLVRTALLLAVMPAVLAAQGERERGYIIGGNPVSLTLFGGLAMPGAEGDLWGFTFDELTLQRRDFNALDNGLDLAIRLSDHFDLVVAYAASSQSKRSEFRDYVDQDDQPIEQTTRFDRRPLSAGIRYHLRSRGRMIGSYAYVPEPFVPFIGVGVGRMSYTFRQSGDFVDEATMEIFRDQFTAKGRAAFAQVSAGAAWTIAPSFALTGEVKYLRASGSGNPSFEGFDRLDLSGVSTTLGLTIRFARGY